MRKASALTVSLFVLLAPQALSSSTLNELLRRVEELPWTEAGRQAFELYMDLRHEAGVDAASWFKLGLVLYDGRYYRTSLLALRRVTDQEPACCLNLRFGAYVWQGHVLDILKRRTEAVEAYTQALDLEEKQGPGTFLKHDQYRLRIDRRWVLNRLKRPFRR